MAWIDDDLNGIYNRAFQGLHNGLGINADSGQSLSNNPAIGDMAINLVDGTAQIGGQTAHGTVGTEITFNSNYDLSEFAEGRNELEHYNRIGIAFWRPSALDQESGNVDEDKLFQAKLDNFFLVQAPFPNLRVSLLFC